MEPIEADAEAGYLDCTPLESDDGEPAVMLWLDVDGDTCKLVLTAADARELIAGAAEALAVLDGDDE